MFELDNFDQWCINHVGLRRVMLDQYEGVLPSRAGHHVDVVFIRNDGWSLGAPIKLEQAAYEMWQKEWIQFIRRPDKLIRQMGEYATS